MKHHNKKKYTLIKPEISNDGLNGLTYDFIPSLKKHNLNFSTPMQVLAEALARFTEPDVNENTPAVQIAKGVWRDEGIRSRTSCNGVHHALIVAKFSRIVAHAMLQNESTRGIIEDEITKLNDEKAKDFLSENGYRNYFKIVEIMALFHDIGRPQDGIDRWDDYNEKNVIQVMDHFLGHLAKPTKDAILAAVEAGIKDKDKNKDKPASRLFGYPVGAGDALHSGHAFHGGAWDNRDFNPKYVRVYTECEEFRDDFLKIQKDARKFIPVPEPRFYSIEKYAANIVDDGGLEGGPAMLPNNFAALIMQDFSRITGEEYPTFDKYMSQQGFHEKYAFEKNLVGGYSQAKPAMYSDTNTGEQFVFKNSTEEEIAKATMASTLLREILQEESLTIAGKSVKFHTPEVTQEYDKQRLQYMQNLSANHPKTGKKLQGLASIDNVATMAKFGVVFQFLMLGDNMSHNIRLNNEDQFCIFDFDEAFFLGGNSLTSPKGVFVDSVSSDGHALNNHFLDLLELRNGYDKYGYIAIENSQIALLKDETWKVFFAGTIEGLKLIQAKLTNGFVESLPENNYHEKEIKGMIIERMKSIDSTIAYIDDIFKGKTKLPFKIDDKISFGIDKLTIQPLKDTLKSEAKKFSPDPDKLKQYQACTRMDRKMRALSLEDLPGRLRVPFMFSFPGENAKGWTSYIELGFDSLQHAENFSKFISDVFDIKSKKMNKGQPKVPYLKSNGRYVIAFKEDNIEPFVQGIQAIRPGVLRVIAAERSQREAKFKEFFKNLDSEKFVLTQREQVNMLHSYKGLLKFKIDQQKKTPVSSLFSSEKKLTQELDTLEKYMNNGGIDAFNESFENNKGMLSKLVNMPWEKDTSHLADLNAHALEVLAGS